MSIIQGEGEEMTETPTGSGGQTNPLPKADPCPFCGCNKVTTWHIGHYDVPWIVECWNLRCRAQGPRGATEREAIELWNRRVM